MSETSSGHSGVPHGSDGNMAQRIGLYYRQVVSELRKVIWPTRNELVTYTIVSMVFVVIMIAIIAGLDYGFTRLILSIFD